MAVELATAYISLVPSAKGIGKSLQKELGAPLEAQAEKSSRSFTDRFSKVAKVGIAAAGGAIAGVLGTALVKGFGRLQALDDARFKLQGLGHDAAGVEKIMDSALASVKGTAFGLGDAATIAASAVAAGIEPGEALTRTLSLTGDAATIAGVGLDEMGSIFGKVAANNRMMTEELNQLQDRGIPILSYLQEELGLSATEVREFVSSGKVDFELFQKIIEDNIGGAALSAGESFRGSLANMGAALGRFGARLLEPVFQTGPGVFAAITGAIDDLTERVGPFVDEFGGKIAGMITSLSDTINSGEGGFFSGLLTAAQNIFGQLVTWLAGPGITQIFETILAGRDRLFQAAVNLFPALIEAGIQFIPQLLDWITGTMIPQLLELIVGSVPRLLQAGVILFQSLVRAVVEVLPDLVGTLLGEVLPTVLDSVLSMVPNLLDAGLVLFLILVEAVLQVLPDLVAVLFSEVLPAILETVLGMLPDLLSAGVETFLALVMAVLRVLPDLISILVSRVLPALLTTIVGMIPELLDAAIELFTSLIDAIPVILPELLGVIVTDLIPAVIDAVMQLVPKLFEAGKEIIKGLIRGIGSMVGAVKDAVGNLLGKARDLLPFSPAREGPFSGRGWTLYSGRAIVEGLAEGIGQRQRMLVGTVAGLAGAAHAALPGVASPMLVGAGRAYAYTPGPGAAADARPSAAGPVDLSDDTIERIVQGMIDGARVADAATAREMLWAARQGTRR